MLTKIIFTALVVAAVYALVRLRARAGSPGGKPQAPAQNRFGRFLSYAFAATLVVISAGFYLYQRQSDNEVVSVRVVNGSSGNTTTYRVLRPTIEGKKFVTADGRTVYLGASDRVEILQND